MPGHQNRRVPWLVAAVTLSLLAVGTSPAAAHTHPTPIERASPGVVYIEARAKVEVALIEHHQAGDTFGVHIGIVQSTWNPVLDSASGFVVDPTGGVVTSGAITSPDLDRARVFAVNQAFHERYGSAAPLPKDPYSRHQIGDSTDRNEQRLQACYPPNVTNDAGGCVIRVTPDYVVYPYVTSQQRYGGLHAEALPGGTPDVAVLRLRGANSMPTVPVGASAAGAEALGVLGFTGIPGQDHPLLQVNQHLATEGGSQLKTTGLDPQDVRDAARLSTALRQGMKGGPVLDERGQAIGLLPRAPAPGSAAPPLVGIASVLPVLAKAGISAHGGPVDANFEAAMHLFKNGGYAASVPGFSKALELFPGHFLASRNMAIANQRAASGASASGTAGNGTAPAATAAGDATSAGTGWLWLAGLLIAAALLAAAAMWFTLHRRRRSSAMVAAPGPVHGQHPAGGPRPPAAPGQPVSAGTRAPAGGAGTGGPAGPASRSGSNPSRTASSVAAPSSAHGGTGRPPSARPAAPSPGRGSAAPGAAASGAVVAQSAAAQEPSAPGPRFCTSCGGRLAARHQFCGWCGEPVG
jgi:hypothetical protein